MLWFEQALERWGRLRPSWFVVSHESAKDQVLGVDTLGQQVLAHVWYGTACLIIRDDVGNMPYSDEWQIGVPWTSVLS
jgi:hypothetical protein